MPFAAYNSAACGATLASPLCYADIVEDTPKRNGDEYVREGGPYADLIRELVESGPTTVPPRWRSMRCHCCAPRSLLHKARRDWLRAEIQKGIDSAKRAELIPAGE